MSGVRAWIPHEEAAMAESCARFGVVGEHVPRGSDATAVVEESSPAYKKPQCSLL